MFINSLPDGGIMEIVEFISSSLYDIIVGVIILLVGFGAGLLVRKILGRVLHEIGLNGILAKANINANVENGAGTLAAMIIYLITIVLFLDKLGIRSIVMYLILGAVLMLIILTLLVSLKDILPNLIGWLALQKQGHIREGHHVEIKEIAGKVLHVGYLETEIKTERGDCLYVPNALFLKSRFKVRKE